MSEKLRSLGVPPEYFAHARHFAGVFRNLGMTPTQIDDAIRWGAAFNGKPEDRLSQFYQFCDHSGIAEDVIGLSIAWHEQVSEHGIEAMPRVGEPAGTSPDGDARRKAEIEADMQKPRGDSDYWKNPDLRDEYLAILARESGGGDGDAPAAAENFSPARKAEIERVMRQDRARYHQSGMDQEYLAILQSENGEPVASPQPTTGENSHAESTDR